MIYLILFVCGVAFGIILCYPVWAKERNLVCDLEEKLRDAAVREGSK